MSYLFSHSIPTQQHNKQGQDRGRSHSTQLDAWEEVVREEEAEEAVERVHELQDAESEEEEG